MSKKEIKFISYMQVAGTILVALSHSFSGGLGLPAGVLVFVKLIQWAALTSFMWCSGYLFAANEPAERYGIKKYYVGRLERLMLPYVFVSLVMLLPKILLGAANGKIVSTDAVKLLFFPRESVLPHLWFLPTLMIISLLAPLFERIIKNKWGAAALAAVTIVLVILPEITGFLALDDVKKYTFWFVFGMITAKSGGNASNAVRVKWPLAAGAAISYVLILLTGLGENIKFLLLCVCSLEIMLFLAETISEHCGKLRIKKYTMVIYILSVPAQNAFEILLEKTGIRGWLGAAVLFAVGVALPMATGAVVSKIFAERGKYFPGKLIGLPENKF